MPRSVTMLFLFFLGLSFAGFGCKERDANEWRLPGITPPATQKTADPPHIPSKPYTSKKKEDRKVPSEVILLRDVLDRFSKASAFEVEMNVPAGEAHLLYTKDRGIYGSMKFDEKIQADLYLTSSRVFFRASTGTWEDISSTKEGANIRTMVAKGFALNPNQDQRVTILDNAVVKEVKDDPIGCKRYILTQTYYTPVQFTQNVDICVKDDYPAQMTFSSPQGTFSASYKRFNDGTILQASPEGIPVY